MHPVAVTEFAVEENHVSQHGEVKQIQKGVYARPLLHSTSQLRTIISASSSFPLAFSRSDMTE